MEAVFANLPVQCLGGYPENGRGATLMRAAVGAGVAEIAADCGGCLNCATCHVIVDGAWAGRFVVAPSEIPAGAVMAILGGPYLVWLLRQRAVS